MIELIPAIDIIGGRLVRLTQGDYATSKVYADDPAEAACRLQDLGFRRLHVVDLDGARSRHVVNIGVLRDIAARTSLVVDFGGGVKSAEDLQAVFDAGAAMATVGSMAAAEPRTVEQWISRFGPSRIVLGADVRHGLISVNGWKQQSTLALMPFIDHYAALGITHVVCTDISRDGTLQGPATALYRDILRRHPALHLIASGGVAGAEDIRRLQQAGVPAVVFGKAIYEGRIDLPALIREFPQDTTP